MIQLKTSGRLATLVAVFGLCGCGGHATKGEDEPPPVSLPLALRINEVVTDNEGVYVDELGQADDYVEIINASTESIELGTVRIRNGFESYPLPSGVLEPGKMTLFWADREPEQGVKHLPFGLGKNGEQLSLELEDGTVWDNIQVPSLAEHHAWARFPDGKGAFRDCSWASPGVKNGDTCNPASTPELPEEIEFADYVWPATWPAPTSPLALTELALRPADFVEVLNTTDETINLADYALRIGPSAVGRPWPTFEEGAELAWPATTIAAHERLVVPLTEGELGSIAADPRFEGVVTLWKRDGMTVTDRVDFDTWPEGAILARDGTPAAFFRFCETATPGADSDVCKEIPNREVESHLRALHTSGDFEVLAAARARTGIAGVEFIVDMAAGDRVTLLDSSDWDLHYLFVSEVIDGQPHLDRCTSKGYLAFHQGWYDFSVEQYFQVEGRRYLLGNLVHHAGPDLYTVEFSIGDVISPEQMERAFYAVLRAVPAPTRFAIRPQDASQVERARLLEGRVPLVDPNAPYRGVDFQPLTPAVAYGTLRYVPANDLDATNLGPHDILVTDQVPNDLPFVAGLITEAIQTPLSHVNILSRARGTPNMFLRNAQGDPRISPLLDGLVRLEVRGADFILTQATAEEALAFWAEREGEVTSLIPRLDDSLRGPQPLAAHDFASLPAIGGKAAQLAELLRVPVCSGTALPQLPFAVPVAHYLEHFSESGAKARLTELRTDPEFIAAPRTRDAGLAEVRAEILGHPVDSELLDSVLALIESNWPGERIRLRSSSNTEDLSTFSGAGLYDSVAWQPADGRDGLARALRTVWASLWNTRAYDEREAYHVEQSDIAMGILVHPAYYHEAANGVIVSRDIFDPMRGDRYYVNAQVGEALVTNPAPGVTSDQFAIGLSGSSQRFDRSISSLPGEHPVLRANEVSELVCSMQAIHDHFRALLDPDGADGWFAMDVEFKLMGEKRELVLKQARPYSFGVAAPKGWCDL